MCVNIKTLKFALNFLIKSIVEDQVSCRQHEDGYQEYSFYLKHKNPFRLWLKLQDAIEKQGINEGNCNFFFYKDKDYDGKNA